MAELVVQSTWWAGCANAGGLLFSRGCERRRVEQGSRDDSESTGLSNPRENAANL